MTEGLATASLVLVVICQRLWTNIMFHWMNYKNNF